MVRARPRGGNPGTGKTGLGRGPAALATGTTAAPVTTYQETEKKCRESGARKVTWNGTK